MNSFVTSIALTIVLLAGTVFDSVDVGVAGWFDLKVNLNEADARRGGGGRGGRGGSGPRRSASNSAHRSRPKGGGGGRKRPGGGGHKPPPGGGHKPPPGGGHKPPPGGGHRPPPGGGHRPPPGGGHRPPPGGGHRPPPRRYPVGAAIAGAIVVGTIIATLPPSCNAVIVNGISYHRCGSTYYERTYRGSDVVYIVVDEPY